jgi:hypothetical protein
MVPEGSQVYLFFSHIAVFLNQIDEKILPLTFHISVHSLCRVIASGPNGFTCEYEKIFHCDIKRLSLS